MKHIFTFSLALLFSTALHAQDIELPAAHKTGGLPLMEALANRATARAFDARELSLQQLSDLTWAAVGINRADGKRTAPSAHNSQEIELYVLLKQGAYVYDAVKHSLHLQTAEDLRKLGGVGSMPVVVLFVADTAKSKASPEEKKPIGTVDSGFVSENIYLYCASEGLSTGYRLGGFDAAALGPKLKLRPEQLIVGAQSVGYPSPQG